MEVFEEFTHSKADAEDTEGPFKSAAQRLVRLYTEDDESGHRQTDAVAVEDAGLVKRRHRLRTRRSV